MKKVALITGSSRGIGRAIAQKLAADGYAVGINYCRSRSEAERLVEELRSAGRDAACFQADVADRSAVEAMAEECRRRLGPITLLVNNAGVSSQGLFQDMDDALWDRLLAVNVTGVRNAVCAVLPHMLHEKDGCIVNLASVWGLRGASCEAAYACTKAAVVGLTRSLALELAPSHIRVNAVAPGCIETDMLRELGAETVGSLAAETPLGRLGTPQDIANAVAFLSSQEASFITGQILTADGGFAG